MNSAIKYVGSLIEYLDHGGLHPAVVLREQGDKLVIRDQLGHERTIARELVMMRHGTARAEEDVDPAPRIAALEEEKTRLRAELDLTLLWEVVQEQGRAFSAEDLADFHAEVAPALIVSMYNFKRTKPVAPGELEESTQRSRVGVHVGAGIADARHASGHGVDSQLGRLDVRDLVPAQRR